MGKIETHGKRLHTKEDTMEGTYTPEKIDTEGAHTCRDRTEYLTYMNLKGNHPMKGMHTPDNIVLMVAVTVKATVATSMVASNLTCCNAHSGWNFPRQFILVCI